MQILVDLVKSSLLPGSITSIMLVFTTGVALLYAKPRWGRIWLTCVTLAYWMLSTPAGTSLLARTVMTRRSGLQTVAAAEGATAVVMLGGGSHNVRAGGHQLALMERDSALRAIEAARVYHLLGSPLVIVSGGVTDKMPGAAPESDAYEVAMRALDVPAERVVSEAESRNTHDEAIVIKRMLRERRIDRFVLVTSPLHMERSLATFAAQGLHPTPSPSALHSDWLSDPFPLIPNDGSLDLGSSVVYEWLGWAYYWWKGWTRAEASSR